LFPPQIKRDDEDSVPLEEIEEMLERRTGYDLDVAVLESYDDAIEALCSGKADVAWLATPAYIIANDTCGSEAVFSGVRQDCAGQVSQIMVQADQVRQSRDLEPIRSLQDLDGKAFGFTDPLSITGHLIAKGMLLNAGVKPGHEVFLGGDAQAVLAIYRGEIDAAAGYWSHLGRDGSVRDARAILLDVYPDAAKVVKVLCLSDPVPNDAIVFRRDLPPRVKDKLVLGFIGLARSRTGSEILYEAYGVTGLVSVGDRDYDFLRRAATMLHIDFADIPEGDLRQQEGIPQTVEVSDREPAVMRASRTR